MARGFPFIILVAVIIPSVLVTLAAGSSNLQAVIALAAGACAFSLMAVNLFLATRPRFIEPFFGGLDRLYLAHKWTGILILAFALLHESVDMDIEGLIIATGLAKTSVEIAEFVFPLLLGLILVSWIKRFPKLRRDLVPYWIWRWSHRGLGVVFVALFVHQFFVKVPFTSDALAAQYLNILGIIGVTSFLYTQFLAPFRPRKYTVSRVEKHPAATIIEAKPAGRPKCLRPGSFAVISFASKRLREPHPFTVSQCSGDGTVQFSIRALGDFTSRLRDRVEVGTTMKIESGYGRFDYRRGEVNQVWVAGGIGITPFLAFADTLNGETTQNIHLVYSVTNEEEFIGLKRLQDARDRMPGFSFSLHVSKNDGRLDARRLAELTPFDISKSGLWFCGPARMRQAIVKGLSEARQKPKNVYFEEFEFR